MRPVMIAMGSLILAGNLLLAVPLRQNAVTLRSAEQAERDVRKAVIEHLEARGLEPASAQELAAQHEERWGRKTLQGLTHFQLLPGSETPCPREGVGAAAPAPRNLRL